MKPFLTLSQLSQSLSRALSPWRVPMQFVAGAFALALGFWGWSLREPTANWSGHLNNFFRTLQLITLQFPPVLTGEIPWQLQVARLLLPLVAVVASIQIFIGAATRPIRLALLPRLRDHVILYGVNQITEAALLSLVRREQRVVLAAPLISAAQRGVLEGFGLTVVDTEFGDETTLRALNVKQARAFLIFGADDLQNLNLAAVALHANRDRNHKQLDLLMAVTLDREDVAGQIEAALDGVARAHRVSFQRLCPDRDGLRLELARLAPVFTRADKDAPAHILIIGLAGNWEQVVTQLIVSAQDHPTNTPVLSLVTNKVEQAAFSKWRAARPDLDLVIAVEALLAEEGLPDDAETRALLARHGPPQLVVVLCEDIEAVAIALALRKPGNAFEAAHTPLLVRQTREDRLLKALGEAKPGGRDLTRMTAFGGLVRTASIDRILDRKGDEFAMALHAFYLGSTEKLPAGSPASRRAWDDLSENLREANRASAAHMPVLFASRGLRIVAANERSSLGRLNAADVEWLARVEHRRWMADRIERGWRYGPARDDALLVHPSLVDYDRLSETEREKDRSAVRAMVNILAQVGKGLAREGGDGVNEVVSKGPVH